jgi:hypothetical protein
MDKTRAWHLLQAVYAWDEFKLEQHNDGENIRERHDPIESLMAIKEVSHNAQDHE